MTTIDDVSTNDMNFKHLDTTKNIVITPKDEFGNLVQLNASHTWTAKVSDETNYVGDYQVTLESTSIVVNSADFTNLPAGHYHLEVWEEWTDSNGKKQCSIYPSPRRTIDFTIYHNVSDLAEKEIKTIGFQDVVDQAVMNIGMNYVFKVNTVEPDDKATVVQAVSDGKNYVTFNIPQGKTGDRGFRGPDGKAFHIEKTFPSVKEMNDSQGKDFEDGDFALISNNVNDPDNAKLYVWDGKQFNFATDMSGAQGIQGPAGPAATIHVTKAYTVPAGQPPVFKAIPKGDGNFDVEVGLPQGEPGPQGPKGDHGISIWAMKMTVGGNVSGRYITDLYNASATNLPAVNDLVIQPDGNVYQIIGVSNTDNGSNGGGTFNLGSALFSIKGDQNEDFYKPGKMTTVATGAPYDDLNTFPLGQTVTIAETPDKVKQIKNLPPISNTTGGLTVRTESSVNDTIGGIQIAIDNNNVMYHRICWGASGQWGAWRSDSVDNLSNNPLSYLSSGSFNDLPLGTVFADATQMTDGPDTSHGFTTTTFYSSQWNGRKAQIAIADDVNLMYFRVGGYFGIGATEMSWNSWVLLSDDSKVVHKVDEHSNNSILPTLSLFQKVGVVGDSYASGELAFDGQYVDHYEISWLQILARKDGFTGTNFSKGGMSTRTWLMNQHCMPLMQSSDAQDLYILALGINDEALGASYIGSEADIDNGADTFYGNYGKIIKAIQTKAPQAKLVIATIADSSDIATKFNEAISTIANHFAIPVIVQLDDPLFNSSFYRDTMIGGHPTGPVYASMAEAFERLIGQSMIDHLDYYKTFKKDA